MSGGVPIEASTRFLPFLSICLAFSLLSVLVAPNSRVVGIAWSAILIDGSFFTRRQRKRRARWRRSTGILGPSLFPHGE